MHLFYTLKTCIDKICLNYKFFMNHEKSKNTKFYNQVLD